MINGSEAAFERVQAMTNSNPKVKYYRTIEQVETGYQPPNTELFAFEYKGFRVTKESSEYNHWGIRTKENGIPPVPLRSLFTNKTLAMGRIDDFWKNKEAEALANNKAIRE